MARHTSAPVSPAVRHLGKTGPSRRDVRSIRRHRQQTSPTPPGGSGRQYPSSRPRPGRSTTTASPTPAGAEPARRPRGDLERPSSPRGTGRSFSDRLLSAMGVRRGASSSTNDLDETKAGTTGGVRRPGAGPGNPYFDPARDGGRKVIPVDPGGRGPRAPASTTSPASR